MTPFCDICNLTETRKKYRDFREGRLQRNLKLLVRMEGASGTHYPYPRTAHIAGSAVVDDDESVDSKTCGPWLKKYQVVIQEKVDGTNVGVHFGKEGIVLSFREK
jgi:hypothetical protein